MVGDTVTRLTKNIGFAGLQHLVTAGSSLLLMLFLPRYLGPVEYGWLFLASSITGIFGVVVEYGGGYLVAKDVAQSPDLTGKIMINAIGFRLVLGVVSIGIILAYGALAGYSANILVVLSIYAVGILWQGIYRPLYASYQGRELMKYPSLAATTTRLFHVVTIMAAIAFRASVSIIAVLYILGNLTSVLVLWRFLPKIVSTIPRIDWSSTRQQIRQGAPFFLFTVFGTIYYHIDSIMLSKMSPEAVVGWYGAAYRLFESANFLTLITPVFFPVLARFWGRESSSHSQVTVKALEYSIILGIPMSLGVILFAGNIVNLFYGTEKFGPTIILLQLLSGGLVLLYADMILGTTLLASGRQWGQALLSFVAIPLNIALNLVFIPLTQAKYDNGAIGAAIATGLTELVIMIGMIRLVPRGVLTGFRYSVVSKSVLASMVMGWSVYGLGRFGVPWPVQIGIASGVYIGMILALKIVEPMEKEIFRKFIVARAISPLQKLFKG